MYLLKIIKLIKFSASKIIEKIMRFAIKFAIFILALGYIIVY